MDNANSREYLEKILAQVLENMKRTAHAPSVQMTDVPRDSLGLNDDDEAAMDDLDEDENPDKRHTQRRSDKYVQKNGELSDSEDEDPDERQGRRRRVQANFRHILDIGANDSGVETGSGVGTPMQGSSVPDDADEMNIDSVEQPAPTPSPMNGHVNGSAPISNSQSPAQPPAPADDGDIEMEDAVEPTVETNGDTTPATNHVAQPEEESTITVQQQRTPRDSPVQPQEQEVAQAEGSAPVPEPQTITSLTAPPPTTEPTEPTEPTPEPAPMPAVEVSTVPSPTTAAVEEPEETEPAAEPEAVIKPEPEEANDDIAKAQAAEEGRIEREITNAEGEARTEEAAKAEESDKPDSPAIVEEPKD